MKLLHTIRTIIIEDDSSTQQHLTEVLTQNFSEVQIIGRADSIKSASQLINYEKPELVLMDIKLNDGNSFEIFKSISFHDFEVIFVTAFNNFVQKAIDHYAFSYLLKPIDDQKLLDTVQHYVNLRKRMFSMNKYQLLSNFLHPKDAQFLIKVGHDHLVVRVSDIIKCEAEGNFTYFYVLHNQKHLVSNSLKYYENLLLEKGFFKANRSVLINIQHIASIHKKEGITLKNGNRISVSVRNKNKLNDLIQMLS